MATGDRSPSADEPSAAAPVTLAHISDPHIACMEDITALDLANKRLLGFLRWRLLRSSEHEHGILAALESDLKLTQPDHIAVTGDLTHLGLSAEYKKARQWLQKLGSPSQVTVIPGNHDAYVKINWHQTMAHWADYMISDPPRKDGQQTNHMENIFPSLRIRGCVAIIGVSSARPSAPHLAVGSIGAGQLQHLETILARTAQKRLYRVVLIHHPPLPGQAGWRRALRDAHEVQEILRDHGAELVLHGHNHEQSVLDCETISGPAIVVGVPSASEAVDGRVPAARYNEYAIERAGNGWHVEMTGRAATKDGQVLECEKRVLRSR